jgi:hypothetical protein
VDAQGSGQQGTTTADASTTSAGGDSDTFSFVEVFRAPDGTLQTATVVGDRIPVGSEVVDVRPAATGDTADTVAFVDDPTAAEEATPLSDWVF